LVRVVFEEWAVVEGSGDVEAEGAFLALGKGGCQKQNDESEESSRHGEVFAVKEYANVRRNPFARGQF